MQQGSGWALIHSSVSCTPEDSAEEHQHQKRSFCRCQQRNSAYCGLYRSPASTNLIRIFKRSTDKEQVDLIYCGRAFIQRMSFVFYRPVLFRTLFCTISTPHKILLCSFLDRNCTKLLFCTITPSLAAVLANHKHLTHHRSRQLPPFSIQYFQQGSRPSCCYLHACTSYHRNRICYTQS